MNVTLSSSSQPPSGQPSGEPAAAPPANPSSRVQPPDGYPPDALGAFLASSTSSSAASPLHDHGQFLHFHERLVGPSADAGVDILQIRNLYAFYTDDRDRLAAEHVRQRARMATDPAFLAESRGRVYDPAARGLKTSWLTPQQCWLDQVGRHNTASHRAGMTIRINQFDGLGMREENVLRVRTFAVDADTAKAATATAAFVQNTGLTPSMIVQTSVVNAGKPDELRKFHYYWIIRPDPRSPQNPRLPLERWSQVQAALALACHSDASLDDPPQALRVAGTVNWKDPINPSPVVLLSADGPDYDPEDFIRRSGLTLKPVKRSAGGRKRQPKLKALVDSDGKPIAMPTDAGFLKRMRESVAAGINHAFTTNVVDSVDVRAAASICPALAETFATGGAGQDYNGWFLMLTLAVFDHDPPACAIAMSSAWRDYSREDTLAKLEDLRDEQRSEDKGWTGCRAIAVHHPACKRCSYRTGTRSPLSIFRQIEEAAK